MPTKNIAPAAQSGRDWNDDMTDVMALLQAAEDRAFSAADGQFHGPEDVYLAGTGHLVKMAREMLMTMSRHAR